MATNQKIIDQALSKITVVEGGDEANATDSATALDLFNQMMHEGAFKSMDFNWFTQDTLGDTAPIPKWAEGGIIAMLAVRCAPEFNARISQELYDEAKDGKQLITNTLITQKLDNADMSHLPYGGRARYNIETDS